MGHLLTALGAMSFSKSKDKISLGDKLTYAQGERKEGKACKTGFDLPQTSSHSHQGF
jgi:hypothetical protein